MIKSAIYRGVVVHKRFRPTKHQLRYRVFSMLLDLKTLDDTVRRSSLFSRNRFNIFSFYDRDHAPKEFPNIEAYIQMLLQQADIDIRAARVQILCFPRVLGYVFNPLTVYFCYESEDQLRAIVYEVKNTFGEQRSYVIPVHSQSGKIIDQTCTKELYVSPFNSCEGGYSFQIVPPKDQVSITIGYGTENGTILKAYFSGRYRSFSDAEMAKLMLFYPLMTFKVTAGIYYEAFHLWLKGLPIFRHKRTYKFAISVVSQRKDLNNG